LIARRVDGDVAAAVDDVAARLISDSVFAGPICARPAPLAVTGIAAATGGRVVR
jgi:hypothetical protein